LLQFDGISPIQSNYSGHSNLVSDTSCNVHEWL
jgi:hypothetical protein